MDDTPGALKRFWLFLKRPTAKYSLLSLVVVGFFAGIGSVRIFVCEAE